MHTWFTAATEFSYVFHVGDTSSYSIEERLVVSVWLSQNYPKNAPTCVTEDMEAHPSVCPASGCTYGFTGHVAKVYVSDSNQIVVAYWSVCSDFSPTLYYVPVNLS